MKFIYVSKIAFKALVARKSRTLLTILGIVIGIAAIMLVASIGKGAQNMILGQVESLGGKTIAVAPGKEPQGPTDPAVIETLFGDSLKKRELDALGKKNNVPKAKEIMPVVFSTETVSYKGETFRPMIIGASALITEIFDIYPQYGIYFNDEDVKSKAPVVVIGTKVKDELFGGKEALGEKIKIKGKNFRVIGLLPKKGQVLFFNFDESVIMPYTIAQENIFGIKYFNRIIVRVDSESDIPRTVYDIESTLRELHGITDPEDDDFFVATQEDIAEKVTTITNVLTLFLASVAAISLLVGGVGIMNIMFVSVTERTKEIGLRKALGATKKNILSQFLFEAVALTSIGGFLGILFGIGLSLLASVILTQFLDTEWLFTFSARAALIGFFVSMAVGLVFGLYPAIQASRKSPIEAMHFK